MDELKELAKGDDRILFTGFVQGAMLDELYSNAYIYERNDNTKLITEHHYNIAFEAKKLQERYLQLAGEVK